MLPRVFPRVQSWTQFWWWVPHAEPLIRRTSSTRFPLSTTRIVTHLGPLLGGMQLDTSDGSHRRSSCRSSCSGSPPCLVLPRQASSARPRTRRLRADNQSTATSPMKNRDSGARRQARPDGENTQGRKAREGRARGPAWRQSSLPLLERFLRWSELRVPPRSRQHPRHRFPLPSPVCTTSASASSLPKPTVPADPGVLTGASGASGALYVQALPLVLWLP